MHQAAQGKMTLARVFFLFNKLARRKQEAVAVAGDDQNPTTTTATRPLRN